MYAKALLVLSLSTLAGACRQNARCGWEAQPGPESLKVSWGACADDRPRRIECARGQSGFRCRCIVGAGEGGEVVETFVLPSLASLGDRASATRTANEVCSWSLEP